MRRTVGIARYWKVAFALLWLAQGGCRTFPPATRYPNLESAYFAAMYQWKVNGKSDQQAEVLRLARDIAQERLRELGSPNTIPDLQAAQQVVASPIVLDPAKLNAVSEAVLRGALRADVATWLRKSPGVCQIEGASVSTEWKDAGGKFEEDIQRLAVELQKHLADARQLAERGQFEEALKAHAKAARIHPADAAVVSTGTSIRRQWAAVRFQVEWARTAKERVAPATELAQAFGKEASNEGQVKACLAQVDAALRSLSAFRGWAEAEADPAELVMADGAWTKALLQLAELRGRGWAETVRLRAAAQAFWSAYEYTCESMQTRRISLSDPAKPRDAARWHELSSAELDVLARHLRGGYEDMLPAALSYLVRGAGESLSQGYGGLSFIRCCMAGEIMAYGRRINITRSKDMDPLANQLQFATAKSREACDVSLGRVLLIRDVGVQDAGVNELLTRLVDTWRQRQAACDGDGQPLAYWGVELRRESEQVETRDRDYVLDVQLPQLYVDPVPPEELRAEDMSVGREPRQIVNPDRKERKVNPHLFEQDIIICVRRVTLESKKAVVQGSVTLRHEGAASPLLTLNETFDGKQRKLPGVTLQDNSSVIDQVGLRTVTELNYTNLVVSPMPANLPAKLSTDREVRLALLEYVKVASIGAIDAVLSAYPLTDLLQPAERQRKLGETADAADHLGLCLAYCYQLTAREQDLKWKTADGRVITLAARVADSEWIDTRQVLDAKLTQMAQGPWAGRADLTEPANQIRNLWDNCVRAAQDAP